MYSLPCGLFSDYFLCFGFLNHCSHTEVPVVCYFPILMVLKCRKGFSFLQELEEFGQTIIKCSTEPSHNMDFIYQSVASDTPNDKQKREAGCFYEDPYPGRLRRLLYPEQIITNYIYFEDQHPDNQLHQNDLMVINMCISYESTINLSPSHWTTCFCFTVLWLLYNSCQILEWFNHFSGEPPQNFALRHLHHHVLLCNRTWCKEYHQHATNPATK